MNPLPGSAFASLSKSPLRLVLVLLFAIPLQSGCSNAQKPFRIGTNVWIGYEPLYLGRALGRFDGTPIQLVEMNNATEVSTALRSGVLEGAALTLDEVLTLRQDGVGLRIVLIMDTSDGADALLAQPEFTDIGSLRGKRVGVESTAVGAILLQGALESAGMTSADVKMVHLSIDRHLDAWEHGAVDAIITFDPVRTRLLSKGARELFDSSRIPGRIVDVLVVQDNLDQDQLESLGHLLSGHFAALDALRRHPTESARLMAPRTRLSEQEFLDSFENVHIPDLSENRKLLAGDAPAMTESAQRLAELMAAQRMFRRAVVPTEITRGLFDDRWLPESP